MRDIIISLYIYPYHSERHKISLNQQNYLNINKQNLIKSLYKYGKLKSLYKYGKLKSLYKHGKLKYFYKYGKSNHLNINKENLIVFL